MIRLLFPEGLLGLTIIAPLFLVLFLSWRHEQEVLRAFLLKVNGRIFIAEAISITLFLVLLVLVIARPIILTNEKSRIKLSNDVSVLLVFDVSRSMLAQKEVYASTRLARAKIIGQELVGQLDAKIGIAGFTDIMLAHLFPTSNASAIDYALDKDVQVGSIPFGGFNARGSLDALTKDYSAFFPKESKKKIMVVFTDGDMPVLTNDADIVSLREANVSIFFVGIGAPGELIYLYDNEGKLRGIDPYVSNFNKNVLVESANIAGGEYFSEKDYASLFDAVKKAAGPVSPSYQTSERRTAVELAPLIAIASFASLMFFLYLRRPN